MLTITGVVLSRHSLRTRRAVAAAAAAAAAATAAAAAAASHMACGAVMIYRLCSRQAHL